MNPTPSEVLRALDLSGTDAELLARKAALHERWSELDDAGHLELAALASELERRGLR